MKYRYLKIGGGIVWGTNALTKDDLAAQKSGRYDAILDLENGTQFDPDLNAWVDIEGDK